MKEDEPKELTTDNIIWAGKQISWYNTLTNGYVKVGMWQDRYLICMSSLAFLILILVNSGSSAVSLTMWCVSTGCFFLVIINELIISRINKKLLKKLVQDDDVTSEDNLLKIYDSISTVLFISGLISIILFKFS